MKKYLYLTSILFTVCACDSTTYESLENNTEVVGKVTYTKEVKTIIDANCVGCHSSSGTASFAPLQTYEQLKEYTQNGDLLTRIQKQNGEAGLMPKGGRMAQQKIDLLLKWNTDGLLEK
ncbi:cytochrome c [Flavobacterium sp.]|uniref:cytochrome c n=1 Tax=Flavobacterium sp. TaxID=239 RepID=UPI003D136178